MKTLFLAWQDPLSRRWYPVGRLQSREESYSFAYTRGAEQARSEAGFVPLTSFPDLRTIYRSDKLFPVFSNRVLPMSRPEYGDYLNWLSITGGEKGPMAILSRTGGQRVTDTFEVFPDFEQNQNGESIVYFLVHGLRHMPEASVQRANQLKTGERLLLMHDVQNAKDPESLALRTAEASERDLYLVGYCPRYLRSDFLWLLGRKRDVQIRVERINLPPAPSQFRILCRAVMDAPEGFRPFQSVEYEPIVHAPDPPALLVPSRDYRL